MEIHATFRLNGKAYTTKSLRAAAQIWSADQDEETQQLGRFIVEWLSDKTSLELRTSGSTGAPKIIELPKTAFVASAKQTAAFFNLNAGATALLCLPLAYVAGKMMLVRAMVLGLALDMIPPKTKLSLGAKTYAFGALIPLQAQHNLKQLHQIKTLLIGGAPINISLRKELAAIHDNCVETYGMTETLTHIATRPVLHSTTPFVALPGVTLRINKANCLVIKVPYIMSTPITTQDVVQMHDAHSFSLLGRLDWVINSGGKKIFPEQLEEKLAEVVSVPFFFCGIPDDTLGEKLVLLVETGTTEKNRIMQVVANVFTADKHHIPKAVYCVDAFVYTPSGKLDRMGTKAVVKRQLGSSD
jgi:O-succinylbenzoic acid--CoA ligase